MRGRKVEGVWVAALTVAAIPEAPASAARRESTEDETRGKERPRGKERKSRTRTEMGDEGQEKETKGREAEREKEKEGDRRTSKIGEWRKRRAEKREGRKEGRTRASRRSGRRTHRSQAGQARNLSPSPSFSFDPRPRLPACPSRASHSRSFSSLLALSLSLSPFLFLSRFPSRFLAIVLSLSSLRVQPSPHHSPRAATGILSPSPPLHSSRHREPWPTAFSPAPSSTLSGCAPPRRLKPPFSPLLRALAPARQRQITLHFQSPKELQRPIPPATRAFPVLLVLFLLASHLSPDPRLPPSTELASYVAQPSSRHFPRPCPDHHHPPTHPSHPLGLRDSLLCRASNGCSTPTHSLCKSILSTTRLLLRSLLRLCSLHNQLLPLSPRRLRGIPCSRTCMPVTDDNSG